MKESIPNVIGALPRTRAPVLRRLVSGCPSRASSSRSSSRGTVSVLAAEAGDPIERPPAGCAAPGEHHEHRAFLEAVLKFWRRYVKLGFYFADRRRHGAVCLAFVVGGYGWHGNVAVLLGWTFAAVPALGALVVWITLVNFLYLLTQMAIAVEDVGVRDGMRRVAQFIRASLREVAGIFGVVLLLVAITTLASVLATAGLGLIAVIPFVGLAMVPLQLGAWLLRGVVFEYLALTALGAYLTQYRAICIVCDVRVPKQYECRSTSRDN